MRPDVREAARRVWPYLLRVAKEVLRDAEGDAPAIFESVIESVSLYLNENNSPPHDPGGLLTVAFRHELYRKKKKEKKVVNISDIADLRHWLGSDDPASELDQRILFEEVVARLRAENQGIMRLRIAGYGWNEIAAMLRVPSSTIRSDFWRDVRRAYAEILGSAAEKQEPNEER